MQCCITKPPSLQVAAKDTADPARGPASANPVSELRRKFDELDVCDRSLSIPPAPLAGHMESIQVDHSGHLSVAEATVLAQWVYVSFRAEAEEMTEQEANGEAQTLSVHACKLRSTFARRTGWCESSM